MKPKVDVFVSLQPKRLRLSRARGWRKPEGAVVVSRPNQFGNPFIVGKHGTQKECVRLFDLLCAGYLCISVDRECIEAQERFRAAFKREGIKTLRGKDLLCWCKLGAPCHADTLIKIANA